MSQFVCPECGHSSEFDEWGESAVCPNCGYEPPQGEAMQRLLLEDEPRAGEGAEQPAASDRRGSILARFLPSTGRTFFTGLAYGVLAFAIVMLLASRLDLSGSVARCLGITLPVVTAFIVWRLYAQRELKQ
jgi:hypothetical protein